MNAITITLSDDRLAQLQEMATRFQVSPEELVRMGVEELLAQPDAARCIPRSRQLACFDILPSEGRAG